MQHVRERLQRNLLASKGFCGIEFLTLLRPGTDFVAAARQEFPRLVAEMLRLNEIRDRNGSRSVSSRLATLVNLGPSNVWMELHAAIKGSHQRGQPSKGTGLF